MNSREGHQVSAEESYLWFGQQFKDRQYGQALETVSSLIVALEDHLACRNTDNNASKKLSECYLGKALCLLSQDDTPSTETSVLESLKAAIEHNNLNHWAYFNLFSLHYQSFNYILALSNLKCCLSCLYLDKAVLSKDFQGRHVEKDIGKAIGYSPNNLQAFLLRLLIHISQHRWKKALNQIEILEELLGENKHLQNLRQMIIPYKQPSSPPDQSVIAYVVSESISSILRLKQEAVRQRLKGSQEENNEEKHLIKVINEKVYEFNELMGLVNELGQVFGVFHFKNVHSLSLVNKKIIMLGSLVPAAGEVSAGPAELSQPAPSDQSKKINMDWSSQVVANLASVHNHSSLLDYTKSQMEASRAEIEGNLLSSLHPTKPSNNLGLESSLQQGRQSSLTPVDEKEESNLISHSDSGVLAMMQEKGVDIRAIESQIHQLPASLPPEEESVESSFNLLTSNLSNRKRNMFEVGNDDEFLLDSAFDKSIGIKTKPSPGLFKKQSVEKSMNESSKRAKLEKKSRIYPVKEPFKFIELYLSQIEFKETKEKLAGIYADIDIKSTMSKLHKYKSKQENARSLGIKHKIEWSQSIGFIPIPEEPPSLEVKVMRAEKDKFFDSCLGKGEIQMTSSGLNKFPLYNGTKIIATISFSLMLCEQSLNCSYKQSSISSSVHTNSVNSLG